MHLNLGTEQIELHARHVPLEQRLTRDPAPADDQRHLVLAAASDRLLGAVAAAELVAGSLLLEAWLQEKWAAALDIWMVYGEAYLACRHDPAGPGWWWVREPSMLLCGECGPKLMDFLADPPGRCDGCHDEVEEYDVLALPGQTIVGLAVLCGICQPKG